MRLWPSRSKPPVAEAVDTVATKVPPPTGFTYGIPVGGTTDYNQGVTSANDNDRRTLLEELYQSYLTCPWSSACVDVIARTITAGGVEVVWDGSTDDNDEEAPEAPENVVALRDLLDFVNPTEDIRQLMRGVIADLLVFGDAFLEIVWMFNRPVALYSLDVPSMAIIADEHGTVSQYVQVTETGQRAEFDPRDVIHISLDTPRSGLTGVSPTQKVLLPITVWLFAAATLKEVMRKGDPANIHVDFPQTETDTEIKKWRSQYQVQNLGPRNIGTPITTKGGAVVKELKAYAVAEYINTLDQKRDEILSGYGVPPNKVGVIESGNLGGGTGTSQDKTFRVNTCAPTGEAVLEKLVYHLAFVGFGITDWKMRFGEIDWRDDTAVDTISSTRLRDGRWTLNRARIEIGEPPVTGGDDAILVDRANLVLWEDMAALSKASIDQKEQPAIAGGVVAPAGPQEPGAPAPAGPPAKESANEAFGEAYRRQLALIRGELRTAQTERHADV